MHSIVDTALLVSVVLLVPVTVAAFAVRPDQRRRRTSAVRVVGAATGVAVSALGVAALSGAGPVRAAVTAALLAGSVLVWRPWGRAWAARGLVLWALTVDAGALYLLVVLSWTFSAGLGVGPFLASGLLWLLELFVFVLALGYVWEMVDVLARRHWPRSTPEPATVGPQPFVSLHVPAHNEPPEMVVATLERLLALDYDAYEIVMIDDNTEDPALWRPVEEFCAQHERIRFVHLEDWPGYKSGALNFALTVTDPRAEIVGVVDADYLVEPDFLARCTGYFQDERLGFLQTPQDYRDWEQAPYFRRLYHSYDYFFSVSQRSRNERDGAIFGGTMGLIRRSALEEVGGWDEWCITEDAELSLRLLRAGWRGRHVSETFGRGLMPLTFEALKRQRFRWCFGGVQILRMHGRSLLPGRPGPGNRLTLSQRWAYLVGGLQWFGDLAGLLFTGFLLLGALNLVLGDGLVVRRVAGFVLVCVVVLVVLGGLRAVALVRRAGGASWREAVGAFGLWLALGWCVAQASARGLFAREGAFLRTPKVRGELGWRDALRGNRTEVLFATVCLGVAVASFATKPGWAAGVVGGLLLLQGLGHAAAPLNSLAAIRSDLTAEQRRRRVALPSWSRLRPGRTTLVLGPVFGVAALALTLVVLAAPVGTPLPGAIEKALPKPGTSGPVPATTTAGHRHHRHTGPASPAAAVSSAAAALTRAATSPAAPRVTATRRPTRAASPTSGPTPQPTPTAQPSSAATTPTQKATPTQKTSPTQAARTGTGRPTSSPARGKPSTAP